MPEELNAAGQLRTQVSESETGFPYHSVGHHTRQIRLLGSRGREWIPKKVHPYVTKPGAIPAKRPMNRIT